MYIPKKWIPTKPPINSEDSRTEHFLIEAVGNWIPENEVIFYGLMNSPLADEFVKVRDFTNKTKEDFFRDTVYFEKEDLIRYLYTPDDTVEVDLPENMIHEAIETAYKHYYYTPCSEMMLRHAIIELCLHKFMNSITLAFPWDIKPENDILYLYSIIPKEYIQKFNIVTGSLTDCILNSSTQYTTIIMNDLEECKKFINENEKYRTYETFFLVRNHSKNVHVFQTDDGSLDFEEVGNEEIAKKLINLDTGIPITRMRFARYEPSLYIDRKPIDSFIY